jgi:hypothetical protein
VTGLSTSIGDPAGDTTYVTITGTNLAGTTSVQFGTISASWFVVQSSTQVLTVAPASAPGTVDVTVTTYAGTSATSSADLFTYPGTPTVSSLSASSGSSAGGTALTITGTGFTGTQSVYFGDTIVTDFSVASDTSLTVNSPPSDAGTVDVLVQGPNGISSPSSSTRFSFTAASAPALSSLSTSTGSTPGGTVVSVSGSGFTGANQVLFGEVAAQAFVNSGTQITALSPAQAAATVDVTVLTPTGTSAVSSADHFTYSAGSAPSVTSLSITSGSTGGGTVVTILGSGFTDAVSVQFGTVPITDFNVLNDSSIVATSPAQAAGTVDVRVTNNAGISSTSSADHFTYTAAAAPAVSSITPTSGPATGGTTVTVVGSGFTGATDVTFGGVDAVWFNVLSDNIIEAVTVGGSGTVDTVVTTPSGSSSTGSGDQFTFTTVSAPSITSLSASSGSTAGGLLLTITGSGFTTATDVYFGGIDVTDFVINSDSQISVLTPPSTSGTYDIQVVSAAGASALSSADRFTYNLASAPSVSSIGTSSGTTAGGTSVTISGSNFTAAMQVLFGGTAASSFTVNSDTSITAVSPPLPAGTVDVLVQTPSGTSAAVSADRFTYSVGTAPSVTSLGTTGGSTGGGTSVTIQGSHFTGSIGVKFGTVAAAYFTVVSDTAIVAVSPSQAAGTVHVTVSINGATSSTSSADQFTYTAASTPVVVALSPNSGPTDAGQPVLVTGTHFSGATQVSFGGVAASFQVNSDSSITAYAPFLAAGSYVVQVTTPSGLSSSTGPQYTYNNVTAPAPAVTSLSPNSGYTGGGAVVTLTGTNFSGATVVTFGAMPATSFQINSDTQITATAPSHSSGAVNVFVTTNNGTSSSGSGNSFSYVSAAAPTVTHLSPPTGTTAGGTSVTLTGTGFTGATSVQFGSVAGLIVSINPGGTSMSATSPAQAAGTVNVTVTTPSGTSPPGTGNQFTYTLAPLPTVTSLGTSSGGTGGGTSVAITGTNFTAATGVSFGSVAAASFVVHSSTSITATSPAQSAGPVNVQVSTYAGTSAPSAQFTYTTALTPSVTGLGTTSGTTAGGTSVAVNGSNFTSDDWLAYEKMADFSLFTCLGDAARVETIYSGKPRSDEARKRKAAYRRRGLRTCTIVTSLADFCRRVF